MYPPLLRKQQDSVLLTDRRRLFPLTLPPRHRGRPPLPFSFTSTLGQGGQNSTAACPHSNSGKTPALCCQCRHTNLDKTDSSQCQQKLMPSTGVSPWSSSMSQKSTSQRQGSCLQPCQLISPGHAAYPSISTPAFFALVLYIWQSFPCNSPPSSKETMQRHLNQPQIPVAGEQCSINEAVPTAMRTLLSSSAIKNSMRLSLNAESNPFTWRTQPVSVDLWRRSFYIPCDSKVWHGDEAVHC